MTVTLVALYALLVAGAAVVEPGRARRAALLGLVAYALGTASYVVGLGTADVRVIAQLARHPGDAFFAIDTGMLLLGAAVCAAAGLTAFRRLPETRGRAVVLLGGTVGVAWGIAPLIGPSGGWRPFAAAGAVALGAASGGMLARRFLAPSFGRVADSVGRWPAAGRSWPLALAFGAAALGVAAGPRVWIVFVCLGAAALIEFADRRHSGAARVPWLFLAALVLLPIWWLLSTVAGPVGLAVTSLGEVPLSPAAEVLLALPLALVAWAFLGLWPAQRFLPGGLLAPLGVALWLRVGAPAVSDGLAHWQPALVPLGVLGLWGAAAGGAPARALDALAFVALASDAPESAAAALLLAGAALALSLGSPPRRALIQRMGWIAAAAALPLAFEAGFRAQVTYTLAAAGGVALAMWLDPAGQRDAAPLAKDAAAELRV